MRHGIVYKTGDVILAQVQFTDTFEVKTRPAVVLFEEYGNVVIAGITSNTDMEGIKLSKREGLPKDSVIKLNYILTIVQPMIKKKLFELAKDERTMVVEELVKKLRGI